MTSKPSLHIRLRRYFRAHKAELDSRDSMMASLKTNLEQARKTINTLQERERFLELKLSSLGGGSFRYDPVTDDFTLCIRVNKTRAMFMPHFDLLGHAISELKHQMHHALTKTH